VLLHRLAIISTIVSCAALPGPARAATSADYFAADNSGDLVRVTVTGDKAGPPATVLKGNPETRQTSPAGSDGGVTVGLVADIDAETTTLFTYDTAARQLHDLSSLGSHIGAAAIYAGGGRIAYSETLRHRYVIRSVPAAGGTPTTVFSSRTWQPWGIAVSENGKHVFFAGREAVSFAGQPDSDTHRSGVFRVTSDGKRKLEPLVADPLAYTELHLSPGGKRLAVVRQRLTGTSRARVTVVKPSTGHVRTVLKSYANSIAGLAWAADGSSLVFRDETSWGRLTLTGGLTAIAKTSKLSYPVLAS